MAKLAGNILDKAGLKPAALKVYFFFYNWKKNLVISGRRKIIPILVGQRSKNKIYAIDLDSDWLGLGARIVKTIEILLFAKEHALTPVIRFDYREASDKNKDYFGELFYYKQPGSANLNEPRFTHIRDVDELGWPESYNLKLKLDSSVSLFNEYLGINPDIEKEVDLFVSGNFKDHKILGIHYRGTDKAGEAPLISGNEMLGQIKRILVDRPSLTLVFVSTDDQKMLQFLQTSGLPLPVISRQDAVRSGDGQQFHRKKEISKSLVNRDAIVNMLLLSKCDFLLKTASILSDCSIIFNPDLEYKVISFPHTEELTWWPATEIKQRQEKMKIVPA